MLREFDIVVIATDFEDAEVRGKRGHIIGQVCTDDIGVFVYDIERVWCMSPRDVTPTGERDDEAERARQGAPVIRVNSKGEIVG
ncbi:MAG: hypothetical protein CTY31_13085 [Hyphomicrobium sp.]|nr:MAG: hypothetical protein CTY39_04525 [Hyphomicrobium sp.]PPC98504.1 MAG: hypothetical protein CTY31_13085 [Hyphomicrobium sp.]